MGLVRRGGQGEWVGQLGVEVEGQVVGGFGFSGGGMEKEGKRGDWGGFVGLTKWVDRVFIKGGLGWIIHGPENIGWAWCVSWVAFGFGV